MLQTDFDSLMYKAKAEIIYEDIYRDIPKRFKILE